MGNNGVSYHALGNEVPPTQDAVDKLFSGAALQTQTVNKADGPALKPWPMDSLNSVKPTNVHSHNDYTRDIPVYSAMSAGCIGIEADVFYSDGDVIIGHTSPTPGRTLTLQYVKPILAILNHNNGGSPGPNGFYKAKPEQSIILLVDFKTSDTRTLDAVVKAIQPLREAGYLSHLSGTTFVEKQVTVVASGSAPFDRILTGDGVPNRDVFYDAKVDQWNTAYNSSNSYYASADFKDAIGNPGSVGAFSQLQQDKVKAQVQTAHAAGLKVRYCKFPSLDPDIQRHYKVRRLTFFSRQPAWRLYVGAVGRARRRPLERRRYVRHSEVAPDTIDWNDLTRTAYTHSFYFGLFK